MICPYCNTILIYEGRVGKSSLHEVGDTEFNNKCPRCRQPIMIEFYLKEVKNK